MIRLMSEAHDDNEDDGRRQADDREGGRLYVSLILTNLCVFSRTSKKMANSTIDDSLEDDN